MKYFAVISVLGFATTNLYAQGGRVAGNIAKQAATSISSATMGELLGWQTELYKEVKRIRGFERDIKALAEGVKTSLAESEELPSSIVGQGRGKNYREIGEFLDWENSEENYNYTRFQHILENSAARELVEVIFGKGELIGVSPEDARKFWDKLWSTAGILPEDRVLQIAKTLHQLGESREHIALLDDNIRAANSKLRSGNRENFPTRHSEKMAKKLLEGYVRGDLERVMQREAPVYRWRNKKGKRVDSARKLKEKECRRLAVELGDAIENYPRRITPQAVENLLAERDYSLTTSDGGGAVFGALAFLVGGGFLVGTLPEFSIFGSALVGIGALSAYCSYRNS